MRSSEAMGPVNRRVGVRGFVRAPGVVRVRARMRLAVGCACALLGACAVPAPPAPAVGAPACAVPAAATQREASIVQELQGAARGHPLFRESVGTAPGAPACSVALDGGAVTLRWRADDGGEFQWRRDDALESSEIEARLVAPPGAVPEALLRQAERVAFGDAGCGIDWHRPVTRRATAPPQGVDTVYRGETCQCQAIERRDPRGVLFGLAFRSAC